MLQNNLNKAVVESIAFLDVEVREDFEFCPLHQFSEKMK
jgi:hypothetical protein